MIKELISDLIHEKIKLSTAITRSKLIAIKTGSGNFSNWLKEESEGYENPNDIPSYRRIPCSYFVTVDYGYGKTATVPLILNSNEESDSPLIKIFKSRPILEPIPILENNVVRLGNSPEFQVDLEGDQLRLLERVAIDGNSLVSGHVIMPTAGLEKIIQITKQQLLDWLTDLNNEFPNLENDYPMSSQDKTKAHNVITNNVYGNNNPVNLASGYNVTQQNTLSNTIFDYQKLKDLGVEDNQVEELKTIVSTHKNDKTTMMQKAFKWLGNVTTAIITKGAVDKLPEINEYVQHLLSQQ